MTPAPSTREFFDRLAADYGEARYGPRAGPWRRYFFGGRLDHAAALLGGAPGPILDVGAGPGVLGRALGRPVTAVDLTPAMLPAGGVAADAARLPFADGAAGTLVALGLTSYLPDLSSFLAEAARVLRPDGLLLVSITRRGAPDTMLRALFRRTFGLLRRGRGVLSAGLRIRAWSDGEVRRALERAGLHPLAERRHNATVFPFAYLLRGLSLALARRLERRPGPGPGWASDALLLARKRPWRPASGRPVRLVRVIARLNVGGPARQVLLLTKDLAARGYETTLVTGRVGEQEGDLTPEAVRAGFAPRILPGLGRALRLTDDLRAFLSLLRLLLDRRPDLVHTHTAKAGALGRVAAALAGVRVRIHTFHGHVLHGYFGPRGSALACAAERFLARLSTRIVAVSPEVKHDLCRRHRIAPPSLVEVVPLGLPLDPFAGAEVHRGELRRELGLPAHAPLVGWAGRLVPIKAPELLLEVAERVLQKLPETRFLVAGGGDRAGELEESVHRRGLGGRVLLLGWRDDLPRLWADADLALLTSRNEGTPVALIEAAAAGVPAVATAVGGVPFVVEHGATGLLAGSGDGAGLAALVLELLGDPVRRRSFGERGKTRALARFSAKRLTDDLDRLYRLSLDHHEDLHTDR